jgi:ABC-type phosphate/phosphonate transport system substrate-binding protein
MFTRRTFLGSMLAGLSITSLQAGSGGRFYRIGVTDSVIVGKPTESQMESMCAAFELNGKPKGQFEVGAATDIARRLNAHDLNLAVMGGIEYAWLRASYPEMIPLVTAFTTGVRMKACVLVREDSEDKCLMDLQNDAISLPVRLKRHAYIYLHHAIGKIGGKPDGFFSRAEMPSDSDEGIESVIAKKVDAILVDADSWKAYQERKAARSKKLRVLDKSCAFPTPVVLYDKTQWSKWEILLLKIGLCTAHEKAYSRQMLNFWGVTKFVPYGIAYQRAVEEVLREIPESITPTMMVAGK